MKVSKEVKLLEQIFKAAFLFAESIDEGMVEAYDANFLKKLNDRLDEGVEQFGDPTIVEAKT